jgi:tRNA-specific 2-thiouridylase
MTTGVARAVSLMSGGLDSVLAVRLLLDQHVEVTGINFIGGYCPRPLAGESRAQKAAGQLGVELVELPIDQEFIDQIRAPRYGRGRNMNPCIDCHMLMVKRAWEWGQEHGAQFVATGEVLGQRPMSQTKQGLMLVAKRSGTEGRLLRPLSARLLEPTVPEKEGLVDRGWLLEIQGRNRKRQFELARKYGITEFGTPAGGCLLTDRHFAQRVQEAFDHREQDVRTVELLRLGRHFRLESGARVIVGRNKEENDELLRSAPEDAMVIDGSDLPGPVCLLIPGREADRELAAALCVRYSDRKHDKKAKVKVGGEEFEAAPLSSEESAGLMVH